MRLTDENGAMPPDALPSTALDVHYRRGVYALWRGDRIVYVGQSKNLLRRLSQHARARTCEFTHATWADLTDMLADDPELLDRVEAVMIDRYRPEGNRSLNLRSLGIIT